MSLGRVQRILPELHAAKELAVRCEEKRRGRQLIGPRTADVQYAELWADHEAVLAKVDQLVLSVLPQRQPDSSSEAYNGVDGAFRDVLSEALAIHRRGAQQVDREADSRVPEALAAHRGGDAVYEALPTAVVERNPRIDAGRPAEQAEGAHVALS